MSSSELALPDLAPDAHSVDAAIAKVRDIWQRRRLPPFLQLSVDSDPDAILAALADAEAGREGAGRVVVLDARQLAQAARPRPRWDGGAATLDLLQAEAERAEPGLVVCLDEMNLLEPGEQERLRGLLAERQIAGAGLELPAHARLLALTRHPGRELTPTMGVRFAELIPVVPGEGEERFRRLGFDEQQRQVEALLGRTLDLPDGERQEVQQHILIGAFGESSWLPRGLQVQRRPKPEQARRERRRG